MKRQLSAKTSNDTVNAVQRKSGAVKSYLPPVSGLSFIDHAVAVQRKENKTGMPDNLKSGIESLSGHDMSDVKVHYNASKPAQFQAHAYAQGSSIYVAPGQEKHVPHEAWHVVQQKQGRVRPTRQLKGMPLNDDKGLESEADHMGAKALQMKSSDAPVSHAATYSSPASIQRTVIQRDPWDVNAKDREQDLRDQQWNRLPIAPQHRQLQIGPVQQPVGQTSGQTRHLDRDTLETLKTVLNNLPASHVVGNPRLRRIVMSHDTGGGASFYSDHNNQLTVVIPFDAPSWIYININKWPIGDLATTLLTNLSYSQDPANPHLGNKIKDTFSRDVVGTGTLTNKFKMIGRNFVEWMLRHETGHSVDAAIGWYANRHYRNPALGGWLVHDGRDTSEDAMLGRLYSAVQLGNADRHQLNLAFQNSTGAPYTSLRQAIITKNPASFQVPNKAAALAAFDGAVANGRARIMFLEDAVLEGLDSPWQKGGKGGRPVGNRTYQVEYQHSRWVSYESNKYIDRVSNYQYSGPEEWFAETYAHYFTHNKLKSWIYWQQASQQWGSQIADAAARNWFLTNLDPVNGAGNLIVGHMLAPIAGPQPAMPAQQLAVPPAPAGLGSKLKNVTVTLLNGSTNLLFRILSTAFSIPLGILNYLVYLPVKKIFTTLYRWIAG